MPRDYTADARTIARSFIADLTADQHIRAHALGPINVHIHPEADYPDEKAAARAAVAIAQQLAAWIRDGEVPDAG